VVQHPKPFVARRRLNRSITSLLLLTGLGVASLVTAGGCTEPVTYNANAVAALPANSFVKTWMADLQLKNDSIDRIDVRDKTLYVVSKNKQVTAVNRAAGTIKFVAQVAAAGDRLMAPVELKDKVVFPTAISLELYDFNGGNLKTIPLSVPIRSGAAGGGEMVYFGADDPGGGRVEAIDLTSFARPRWELLTPGGSIASTPVLYLGVLFVGTESGDVYAVNEERKPIWATPGGIFKTSGSIVADLRADESGLYVASKDTILYCINRQNGKLMWQYFSGGPLYTPPIPTSDTVYLASEGVGVAALSKAAVPVGGTDKKTAYDRSAKWVYKPGKQFLAQDEKYAYVMEERHDAKNADVTHRLIVAVDKETGQKVFESQHLDFSVFGTNPRDNTIYAAYPTGQLFAIKPVLKPGQIGELVMTPVTGSLAIAN
jgi:outer membrane protein assembly factor BamB